MTENEKSELKVLIRSYYSIQALRMSSSNQLKLKKDGTKQKSPDNLNKKTRNVSANETLNEVLDNTKNSEQLLYKTIKKYVEKTDEWNLFLKNVKGCGPILAAILITEIDIRKANTVSAIWQYAGTNPAKNVRGRKYIDGKIVVTNDLIKGDKLTKGYLAPYNKFLKTAVLGKLGESFIKTNSPYKKYYDDCKLRLSNSDSISTSTGKPWKECTKAHIAAAANRHMCQQFLIDYYRAVRQMYGLEVRVPYSEEFLGKMHHTTYVEVPTKCQKVTRLEDLGFSTRALNILKFNYKAYVNTSSSLSDIEYLRSIDRDILKKVRGCGKGTYEEIVNKLGELGIL